MVEILPDGAAPPGGRAAESDLKFELSCESIFLLRERTRKTRTRLLLLLSDLSLNSPAAGFYT